MPALTYAPYEELLFFQNILQYGHDPASLATISTSLNENQLVRESKVYDASKFSSDALLRLYNSRVRAQNSENVNGVKHESAGTNGVPDAQSFLNNSGVEVKNGDDQFLEQFVDQLYTRFKDETIQDLRKQEEEYHRLQAELQVLEERARNEQAIQAQAAKNARATIAAANAQPDVSDPVAAQLQANLDASNGSKASSTTTLPFASAHMPVKTDTAQPSPRHTSTMPQSQAVSGTPVSRHVQPAQASTQISNPLAPRQYHQNAQPLSSAGGNAAPLLSAPYPAQGPYPQHLAHPGPGLQRIPSHEGYGPQHRGLGQGRNSPLSQQPIQPYPTQPSYQAVAPGWPSPSAPSLRQPVSPHPGHPHNSYSQVQTPTQPPYHQQYSHTAPLQHVQPLRKHQVAGQGQFPLSASSTPVPRPTSRLSMLRSGNSTPWKKPSPGTPRARSPSRLDREVSPLSDHGSPPPMTSPKRRGRLPKPDSTVGLKKPAREHSATPTANASRSQSVLSTVSDMPDPPKRRPGRPPKTKPETPSTPAPMAGSDSEQQQRSSGRRGRARGDTATSKTDPTPLITNKRKRDRSTHSPAPAAAIRVKSSSRSDLQYEMANLVLVCKTFSKTTSTLLSEIQAHKLGGIFAKPVTERDAPGYKSVVQRPQDLKSIKTAISKGSKAASIVIEDVEATELDADATADKHGESGPYSIGNGYFYVEKNEDLLPPKGIVNLEQLELELVRIFANAVMFNPLPSPERGFGRSLRLRKRGGELSTHGDGNETPEQDIEREEIDSTAGTSTSESEATSATTDEAGIISDAREMFEDVERLVGTWKVLDGENIGTTQGSDQEQRLSMSASSGAEEDDGQLGSVRKRRKVAEQ